MLLHPDILIFKYGITSNYSSWYLSSLINNQRSLQLRLNFHLPHWSLPLRHGVRTRREPMSASRCVERAVVTPPSSYMGPFHWTAGATPVASWRDSGNCSNSSGTQTRPRCFHQTQLLLRTSSTARMATTWSRTRTATQP